MGRPKVHPHESNLTICNSLEFINLRTFDFFLQSNGISM